MRLGLSSYTYVWSIGVPLSHEQLSDLTAHDFAVVGGGPRVSEFAWCNWPTIFRSKSCAATGARPGAAESRRAGNRSGSGVSVRNEPGADSRGFGTGVAARLADSAPHFVLDTSITCVRAPNEVVAMLTEMMPASRAAPT